MDHCLNRVQLNILPVAEGDCIHLRFRSSDGWHNIVIDSGPGPEYASDPNPFEMLLDAIKEQNEKVDLLCFSHIDDDHIMGAVTAINGYGFDPDLICRIWLNAPDYVMNSIKKEDNERECSIRTANELLREIVNKNLPCDNTVVAGKEIVIGDARIQVVLPTQKRLDKYNREWRNKVPETVDAPLAISQDSSYTNGSSIALLCTVGHHRILLTGDAFSSDLAAVGKQYTADQGVSLIKLPHHGSDRNITVKMLRSLKCREFIISTWETEHRPSKQTMELLSEYGAVVGGVTVYGNYPWLRFSSGVPHVCIMPLGEHGIKTMSGIEVYSDEYSRRTYT